MMNWLTHHRTSETFAAQAHEALREGRRADAEALFRRAAAAEELALRHLDASKLRTFGITAVSAVALWCKGTEAARAARLAQECLTRADLTMQAREQLERLRAGLPSPRSSRPSGPPRSLAPQG